jgi:hypothetical protein
MTIIMSDQSQLTDRELFELLFSKVNHLVDGMAKLEQGQAKLEQGQAKLEQGQAEIRADLVRLENKVDVDYVELKQGQAHIRTDLVRLENKIDAKYEELLDKILALKLVTIHIDTAVDNLIVEFKNHRRTHQTAISEIQYRQEVMEIDLDKLKKKVS